MKNFFGLDTHPSDELIHWSSVARLDRKQDHKEWLDRVAQLRSAWDVLSATPELQTHLKVVLEWAHEYAMGNEADLRAGEYL